jgi:CD63 antigen
MALLSGSANCMRYVLFALNFVFVITGIIILGVGVSVQGIYRGYFYLLDQQFFSVPTLLIVIGSFIFIISFLGCYGAYNENYCMVLSVIFTTISHQYI